MNVRSFMELNQRGLIDESVFRKMLLMYNALEQGWSVKKKHDAYVFTRNHEGKKEVFEEAYLANFLKTNLSAKPLWKST